MPPCSLGHVALLTCCASYVICIGGYQGRSTQPFDALNVATFVAYIMTEHASRLRKLFESLDEADTAYLMEESLTPLKKARSLTVTDGAWHKPAVE